MDASMSPYAKIRKSLGLLVTQVESCATHLIAVVPSLNTPLVPNHLYLFNGSTWVSTQSLESLARAAITAPYQKKYGHLLTANPVLKWVVAKPIG